MCWVSPLKALFFLQNQSSAVLQFCWQYIVYCLDLLKFLQEWSLGGQQDWWTALCVSAERDMTGKQI